MCGTGTPFLIKPRIVRSTTRSTKPKRMRPRGSRGGTSKPASTHCRSRRGVTPTMRAACAVSKCADRWVAGAATPYFLRARFGGAAASASPRAAAVGRRPPAFAAPIRLPGAGRVATFRSAPTRQALLQRVHEVDHLGARRSRVGRLGDLLAGDLLLDERLHPAAVRVGVRLGTEVVVRELIDELPRELDLGGPRARRFGAVGDLGEAPHLVGVVERVHHQPLVEGADQHDVLLAVTRPLRDRDLAGVVHRLHQQAVGLVGALLGTEVVGVLEVDRIDLGEGDELLDVDRAVRGGLERLQLLVGEEHVLFFRELVALHDLAALDDALAGRTEELLLDPAPAGLVQHVEGQRLGARRHVETYRNGHETEADGPRPDRACGHTLPPSGIVSSTARRGIGSAEARLSVGPRRSPGGACGSRPHRCRTRRRCGGSAARRS